MIDYVLTEWYLIDNFKLRSAAFESVSFKESTNQNLWPKLILHHNITIMIHVLRNVQQLNIENFGDD